MAANRVISVERVYSGMSVTAPDESRGSKAMLFCPDCAYPSPPDGQWQVREQDDNRTLICPLCGATVTARTPRGTSK